MDSEIQTRRTAVAFVFAIVIAQAGCAADQLTTGSDTAAVTTNNGIFQNGLTHNGIFQNGIYQNGIVTNGIFQNGIFQNGIYQNGIFQNGIFQNGLWQENTVALDVLRNNAYAGKLLQYVYGCAM